MKKILQFMIPVLLALASPTQAQEIESSYASITSYDRHIRLCSDKMERCLYFSASSGEHGSIGDSHAWCPALGKGPLVLLQSFPQQLVEAVQGVKRVRFTVQSCEENERQNFGLLCMDLDQDPNWDYCVASSYGDERWYLNGPWKELLGTRGGNG